MFPSVGKRRIIEGSERGLDILQLKQPRAGGNEQAQSQLDAGDILDRSRSNRSCSRSR